MPLRKLIYSVKEAIQDKPKLYARLYGLATTNKDYRNQKREAEKYESKFGGMWTDHADFESKLAQKNLSAESKNLAQKWAANGYVIIPAAISHDLIDAYLAEVEALAYRNDIPMLITTAELPEPTLYSKDKQKALTGSRLVDDYFFCQASRDLLLHPTVKDFTELVFERPGVLTQSLRFEYGSQQAIHQDTAFVRMNAPMKLAAVWIALEDITPNSGELTYFPGSHTWEGYLFSGEFKHYDAARDGETQLAEWHQWILDEAERRDVKAEQFSAKKGDILFWHAGLAHGGAPVAKENQHITRKSLVGHYCPEGVRPLYHYYKPGQRRFYGAAGSRYTTSYYK